jgi:hypothetical protein
LRALRQANSYTIILPQESVSEVQKELGVRAAGGQLGDAGVEDGSAAAVRRIS